GIPFLAAKAVARLAFSALLIIRFCTPADPVGVVLGTAAGSEASWVAAGVAGWPLFCSALPGARLAEHAVMPAVASNARDTRVIRLFTIARTVPPSVQTGVMPELEIRKPLPLPPAVQLMPAVADSQRNGPTPVASP